MTDLGLSYHPSGMEFDKLHLHCIDKRKPLPDLAFLKALFNLRGNIDKCPSLRDIEPKLFPMAIHISFANLQSYAFKRGSSFSFRPSFISSQVLYSKVYFGQYFEMEKWQGSGWQSNSGFCSRGQGGSLSDGWWRFVGVKEVQKYSHHKAQRLWTSFWRLKRKCLARFSIPKAPRNSISSG